MNIIFESQLYPQESERYFVSNSKVTLDYAAHNLNKAICDGFRQNNQDFYLVNIPNLGSFPSLYKKPKIKGNVLSEGISLSYWNFSYLKRFDIKRRLYKTIDKLLNNNRNGELPVLLLYNFRCVSFIGKLKAKYPSLKVCMIVTDLPEYMVTPRKSLYNLGSRIVGKGLTSNSVDVSSIDGFIFLASKMSERLSIGDKPWIQMEGIYESDTQIGDVVKSEKKTILYTGNLGRRYGVQNLLDAFSGIQGDDYQLWLRGSGDCLEIVQERMKADKRISLLPSLTRQELLKLQKKATILINPVPLSEEFTNYFFPSKTLEYLASGTPVLMYHLSCLPKEYDEHLIYIDEDSVEGIRKKVVEVCNKPAHELKEIGQRASLFIMKNKTPKPQIGKVLDFLKEL